MSTIDARNGKIREAEDEILQHMTAVGNAANNLAEEIDKAVSGGIVTKWGTDMADNLRKYVENDIEDAKKDMKNEANKLVYGAQAISQYSEEGQS